MDAFSGYHQIKMYPPDVDKTLFIMERGLYCYKVMPFGLKNAEVTYQRLVNKMFKEMMGKIMKVYIDDMLIKSLEAVDHIAYLEKVFDVLWKHMIMLNPSKCFLMTKHGIKANLDQIQAFLAMNLPRNIHEVHQLTGRVAALNIFISKSSDKCMSFFKIMRKIEPLSG